MKILNHIWPLALLLLLPLSASAQKPAPKNDPKQEAIERHYQFLEQEMKVFRAEMGEDSRDFKEFVQREREAHQQFLMWTIGIITAVLGVVVIFLGFQTRKDLKEMLLELKNERLKSADIAFQSELRTKLREQHLVDEIVKIAKDQYAVGAGNYLFIAPTAEQENLKLRFAKAGIFIEAKTWEDQPDLTGKDAVIYYFNPISAGEKDKDGKDIQTDITLRDHLIPTLMLHKNSGREIPLVVYAHGKWIVGSTHDMLTSYSLHHVASNEIALIDNVASAFRVNWMLKNSQKQS